MFWEASCGFVGDLTWWHGARKRGLGLPKPPARHIGPLCPKRQPWPQPFLHFTGSAHLPVTCLCSVYSPSGMASCFPTWPLLIPYKTGLVPPPPGSLSVLGGAPYLSCVHSPCALLHLGKDSVPEALLPLQVRIAYAHSAPAPSAPSGPGPAGIHPRRSNYTK